MKEDEVRYASGMRHYDVNVKKLCSVILLSALVVPFSTLAQSEPPKFQMSDYYQLRGINPAFVDALGDTPVATFPIPVLLGVEVAQLTKNFGDPRPDNRTHQGLDIMSPFGTPVVSPTDAIVISTGNTADAGLYVYTFNPGGDVFAYMHLREYAAGIQRGAAVKRGDVLGYVGNTGNASGGAPHLHFEVRHDGATDPYPRLTQVFSIQERIMAVEQALQKSPNPTALAQTLATNFKSTFTTAKAQGISLPQSILSALDSGTGISVTTVEAAPVPIAYTLTTGANTGYTSYTRDLEKGMKGDDVRSLQKYLNANGYLISNSGDGSPGLETTYFGALTQKALITFQSAKGISPAAGYFGPKTRAYVSSH